MNTNLKIPKRVVVGGWLVMALVSVGFGAPDFQRDVLPVLEKNCLPCHNTTRAEASLNLESPALMVAGGDAGTALRPGDSKGSLVFRVSSRLEKPYMPPQQNKVGAHRLSDAELKVLSEWIDAGAKGEAKSRDRVVWSPLDRALRMVRSLAVSPDGATVYVGRGGFVEGRSMGDGGVACRFEGKKREGLPAGDMHPDFVSALAVSGDGQMLATGSFGEVTLWRREEGVRRDEEGFAVLDGVSAWRPLEGGGVFGAASAGAVLIRGAACERGPVVDGEVLQAALSKDGADLGVLDGAGSLRVWRKSGGVWSGPTVFSDRVAVALDGRGMLVSMGKDGSARALDGSEAVLFKVDGKGARRFCASANGWVVLSGDGLTVSFMDMAGKALGNGYRDAGMGVVEQMWLLDGGKSVACVGAQGGVHVLGTDGQGAAVKMDARLGALERRNREVRKVLEYRIQAFKAEVELVKTRVKSTEDALKKYQDEAKVGEGKLAEFRKAIEGAEKALLEAETAERDSEKGFMERMKERERLVAEVSEGKADKNSLDEVEKGFKESEGTTKAARTKANEKRRELTEARNKESDVADARLRVVQTEEVLKGSREQLVQAEKEVSDAESALKQVRSEDAIGVVACVREKEGFIHLLYVDGMVRVVTWDGVDVSQEAGVKETLFGWMDFEGGRVGRMWGVRKGKGVRVSREGQPVWKEHLRIGDALSGVPGPFTDRVNALAFSPDGKMLATGSGEPSRTGEIALWSVADGKRVRGLEKPHRDCVLSLAFSWDGRFLASGSADRAARVWDMADGRMVRGMEGHSGHVLTVAFRGDDKVLLTGGAEGALKLWNLRNGDVIRTVKTFEGEVVAGGYLPGESTFVVASADRKVRSFSEAGAEVVKFENVKAAPTAMVVSADGSRIFTGYASGAVAGWNSAQASMRFWVP